MTTVGVEE